MASKDFIMLEFIYIIVTIYLFLSFTGVGIYILLTPNFLRNPVIFPFLMPVCGLLQLSIISAYIISFNLHIIYSSYISVFAGIVTISLSFKYKKDLILNGIESLKQLSIKYLLGSIFVVVALMIVLSPTSEGNFLTTPYRIGIDQVGYTETAQFLFTGGTLKSSTAELLEQLDTKDVIAAKQNNAKSLKFNTYVDSEFLLKALRWGYSAILANLTYITGQDNVLRVAFIGLIFDYALIFALTFYFLFYLFEYSYFISLVASLALLLNCNLLNVYYEGQSAQIFGMPILFMIQISYLWLRKEEEHLKFFESLRMIFKKEYIQLILFIAFLTAGSLCVYNEIIFSLIIFMLITLFLDMVISRRVRGLSTLLPGISIALGFFIVLPFSYKWINFIIPHLKNVKIGGWWQPRWAFPSEILGVFNIYSETVIILVGRTDLELLLNVIATGLILIFAIVYLTKGRDLDKPFWLSAPVFILLIFTKNRYIENIHNYQYMKAYTIFLPVIFAFVFTAITFSLKAESKFLRNLIRLIRFVFIFLIMVNGISYINKYTKERGYVTRDMFDLADSKDKLNLNSYVLITHKLRMDEFMLTPLIPMNWVNLNFAGIFPNVKTHLDKTVAILINKKDVKRGDCIVESYPENIMFENPSFIIIDTKRLLRESYDEKIDKCDNSYYLKYFEGIE